MQVLLALSLLVSASSTHLYTYETQKDSVKKSLIQRNLICWGTNTQAFGNFLFDASQRAGVVCGVLKSKAHPTSSPAIRIGSGSGDRINIDSTVWVSDAIQTSSEIWLAAAKAGSEDPAGTARDLAALLAWVRREDGEDAMTLLVSLKKAVEGQPELAAIINSAESLSLSPQVPSFGPVTARTPGAAERLALMATVWKDLGPFWPALQGFVRSSGFNSETVRTAEKVQTLLGRNVATGGARWRDAFAPTFLQEGREDPALVAASAGTELPEMYREIESWLTEWLAARSFSATQDLNYGFRAPLRNGYAPAASHPLIVRMLRPIILANLDDPNSFGFLTWLAGEAKVGPVAAFTCGGLVLETASLKGVRVDDNGAVSGPNGWADLGAQILDLVIEGSDGQNEPSPAWRGQRDQLHTIYTASPLSRSTVLGRSTLSDALFVRAQIRTAQEWRSFVERSAQRAASLLNNGSVAAAQIEAASEDHARLQIIAENPLTGTWLAKAARNVPARSLEASAFSQWLLANLDPRSLEESLHRDWSSHIGLTAKSPQQAREWVAALDALSPLQTARGRWFGLGSANVLEGARSPWDRPTIAQVAASSFAIAKPWIEGQPGRTVSESTLSALAALCWFGVPEPSQLVALNEALARATAADMPEEPSKNIYRACRLNLAVSRVFVGENGLEDNGEAPLLETDWIDSVPNLLQTLTDDGRPVSVRAAGEFVLTFSKRLGMLSVGPDSAASVVLVPPDADRDLSNKVTKMLGGIEKLLSSSAEVFRMGKDNSQDGLGLALLALERASWRGRAGLSNNASNRLSAVAAEFQKSNAATTGGASAWATDLGFEFWQVSLDSLNRARALGYVPQTFSDDHLAKAISQQLSGAARLLIGLGTSLGSSSTSGDVLNHIRYREQVKGKEQLPRNSGSQRDSSKTGSIELRAATIPFQRSSTPAGSLLPVLGRLVSMEAYTLASVPFVQVGSSGPQNTFKPETTYLDYDGLTRFHLPRRSWSSNMVGLNTEISNLKALESQIIGVKSSLDIRGAIDSLKPLLAAPIVVNLASFRQDLEAAVAEVRRAEAALGAAEEDAVASYLEVEASKILQDIAKIEIERTNILIEIKKNEVDIKKKESDIAKIRVEISSLETDKAANNQKIAKLKEEVQQLEVEKQKIEVRLAARAVGVARTQYELIFNLILQPVTVEGRQVSGHLGAIAYQAEKQVESRLVELRGRRQELVKQLDELKESSWFKGIGRFIGAVVGGVIGGPAGIKIGAMIGESVGGVVASIKQGKPFGAIFTAALDDGMRIAAQSGIDFKSDFIRSSAWNKDLGLKLEQISDALGPVLKELPAFFDKPSLGRALTIVGGNTAVKSILDSIRPGILDDLNADTSKLSPILKNLGELALTGSPEEIKSQLERTINERLNNTDLSYEVIREGASQLGIVVPPNSNPEAIKKEVAQRLTSLVLGRSVAALIDGRDRITSRMMSALTSLQDRLRKGQFQRVADALNTPLVSDEYRAEFAWIREVLANLPVAPGRELRWQSLEPPVREVLERLYPENPAQQEILISHFQRNLDAEGMQAEIQRTLNPWNQALQAKMGAVEATLATRVDEEDDEKRIEQQIEIVDRGADQLQKEVLDWLKNGTGEEYATLRKEVEIRRNALLDAEDKLKNEELTLEQTRRLLVAAGMVRENAVIEVMISNLVKAASTLEMNVADLTLQSAGLEVDRTRLERQKAVLEARANDERIRALDKRSSAAKSRVREAKEGLTAAVAIARGMRNRAVTYGQISGWYQSARVPSRPSTLDDLATLQSEYKQSVDRAARFTRDALRHLRVAGSSEARDGFAPPTTGKQWSVRFTEIKEKLENGGTKGFEEPQRLVIELDDEQIGRLFAEGLTLTIEPYNNAPDKLELYRSSSPKDLKLTLFRRTSGRVFLPLLIAEDDEKRPLNQDEYISEVRHNGIAPIFDAKGERIALQGKQGAKLSFSELLLGIDELKTQAKIKEGVSKRLKELFDSTLFGEPNARFFREQDILPLTGTFQFRVRGKRPKRAAIVLVYISQG